MQKTASRNVAHELRQELGLYSEDDIAALLGVTVPTLRNRRWNGSAPPAYKAGKVTLYRKDEFIAWLNRRRSATRRNASAA